MKPPLDCGERQNGLDKRWEYGYGDKQWDTPSKVFEAVGAEPGVAGGAGRTALNMVNLQCAPLQQVKPLVDEIRYWREDARCTYYCLLGNSKTGPWAGLHVTNSTIGD